jgi:hypothetical protein
MPFSEIERTWIQQYLFHSPERRTYSELQLLTGTFHTQIRMCTVCHKILPGNLSPPVRLQIKFEMSGNITRWKMMHLSPGLPVMEITSRLEACEFSQRDIRAFMHESGFTDQIYRNHQSCFLDAWCMKLLGHQFYTSQLAFIFNINETAIRRSLKNDPQDLAALGRHAAFDEERENILITYIQERNGQLQALIAKNSCSLSNKTMA